MTSRSPTSLPAFLMATASGLLSRPLMTMGEAVMSRVLAMNGVFVPLPAPGAPPSQMNSRGNRRLSRPYFSSKSSQTAAKMSLASLTSRLGSGRGTGKPGLESPGFDGGRAGPMRAPERAGGQPGHCRRRGAACQGAMKSRLAVIPTGRPLNDSLDGMRGRLLDHVGPGVRGPLLQGGPRPGLLRLPQAVQDRST